MSMKNSFTSRICGRRGSGPWRPKERVFCLLALSEAYQPGYFGPLMLQIYRLIYHCYSVIFCYFEVTIIFLILMGCLDLWCTSETILQNCSFYNLGWYLVMSIAQGGNGFSFLAELVYNYLRKRQSTGISANITDIPDPTLQFVVQNIPQAIMLEHRIVNCSRMLYRLIKQRMKTV